MSSLTFATEILVADVEFTVAATKNFAADVGFPAAAIKIPFAATKIHSRSNSATCFKKKE